LLDFYIFGSGTVPCPDPHVVQGGCAVVLPKEITFSVAVTLIAELCHLFRKGGAKSASS